jgi:hypothetical protein
MVQVTNIYVAEAFSHRIRRISSAGICQKDRSKRHHYNCGRDRATGFFGRWRPGQLWQLRSGWPWIHMGISRSPTAVIFAFAAYRPPEPFRRLPVEGSFQNTCRSRSRRLWQPVSERLFQRACAPCRFQRRDLDGRRIWPPRFIGSRRTRSGG